MTAAFEGPALSNSAFSRLFLKYVHRSDDSAALRWGLFLASSLGLFPVLGSVFSVIVIGGALLAWLYVLVDPATFLRISRREAVIATIFVAYVAVILVFAMAHDNAIAGLDAVVNNIGFLIVLPLLPVLRYFHEPDWDRWILWSIGAGGCLTGAVALVVVFFSRVARVEALTGNPLIYAYLAGALVLLNGRLWFYAAERSRWFYGLATVLSLLAVVLSGSRAPLIFAVMIGLLGLAMRLVNGGARNWRQAALVTYVLVIGLWGFYELFTGSQALNAFEGRMRGLVETTTDWGASGGDPGVVSRLAMYKAGIAAFWEHPFAGYGRQNVMAVANQLGEGASFPFTHLHNAYLTDAVASGILGPVALLVLLLTPLIAVGDRQSIWWDLSILFVVYNLLFNMTNIGFGHDIKVFYFCAFVIAMNAVARQPGTMSRRVAVDYMDFLGREAAGEANPDRPRAPTWAPIAWLPRVLQSMRP